MKENRILAVLLFCFSFHLSAQQIGISGQKKPGFFPIVSGAGPTAIYVDKNDYWLVHRTAELLQQDLEAITGRKPPVLSVLPVSADFIIIVGSQDSSVTVQQLGLEKKINSAQLHGQWEKFLMQTVQRPVKGIKQALVIAGSDKRGTAYGLFELSRKMGVSPWYWWADVPVKKQKEIYFKEGSYVFGSPSVKYRGIFINDEAPAFSGWTKEKFGGVNHRVYEKVFELMLRLKANYLWPAMWGNAFNDDDPLNPVLAQQYGIVMGTTHHEPMLRAQQEWKRYGWGSWNYDSNEVFLKGFWRQGIINMDARESIVTVGMRGDGDMPMTVGSNIALLERIVKDQRQIISEVTGKPASETPQLWALYKEVQDYYDKGMRVPDDVTLLLCDDNWGNIRKLPAMDAKPRAGGYGIYYHFDYVGDPRNYKWLNTNSIPRVWEQMNLAYQTGADRIWIVNVGDLKPMELPIQFFLDFAWDTKKWNAGNIANYTKEWSEQIFGKTWAPEIAEILSAYTRYNSRRKPELLSPETYSLINYREAETVETEYNHLAEKAAGIYSRIPGNYRDAFYQLVLYPVKACANLNKLYVASGKNRLYAAQGRVSANDQADSVKIYFAEDSLLALEYNTKLAGGKWNHMMDQTHIGYTYWQQPDKNAIPDLQYVPVPDSASVGLAVEGSAAWWPDNNSEFVLPEFSVYGQDTHYLELFNRGTKPFNCSIETSVPWMKISGRTGQIEKQERIWISIDWKSVPAGYHKIPVRVSMPGGKTVTVFAPVRKDNLSDTKHFRGFVEADGYVSMGACHYSRAIGDGSIHWTCIPEIGRTGSGMMVEPVTAERQSPGLQSSRLEFDLMVYDTGSVQVQTFFSPTLDFHGKELQYALAFDDEEPRISDLHPEHSNKNWEQWVANNIIIDSSVFRLHKPGKHILKFWIVDPGIVLQKIVIGFPDVKQSYLGPPETSVK
jgi:hypothetical protein